MAYQQVGQPGVQAGFKTPQQQSMQPPVKSGGDPYGSADIFMGMPMIGIQQRFEIMEMCGCEARNRYDVGNSPDAKVPPGSGFLHVSEDSECLERICCGPNRTLTLNVNQGGNKGAGPVVMSMHKPFHCQGCCFLRPEFQITAQGQQVGNIKDPFRCCSIDQHIFDAAGVQRFQTGPETICQIGICCPCCGDVSFPISRTGGAQVATVTRPALEFCECLQKTNRLKIDWQAVSDPQERKLIFAAAMLIDLEYFEVQKNDN